MVYHSGIQELCWQLFLGHHLAVEESHQSGNGSTGKGGSISVSDGDDGVWLFMSAGLICVNTA